METIDHQKERNIKINIFFYAYVQCMNFAFLLKKTNLKHKKLTQLLICTGHLLINQPDSMNAKLEGQLFFLHTFLQFFNLIFEPLSVGNQQQAGDLRDQPRVPVQVQHSPPDVRRAQGPPPTPSGR